MDAIDRPTPEPIVNEYASEALEPIYALLQRAVDALGATEEIIADNLRIAGVTGQRMSAAAAPEVIWLQRAVDRLAPPELEITIEEIENCDLRFSVRETGYLSSAPGIFCLPRQMVEFADAFDGGEYPELVARPEQGVAA